MTLDINQGKSGLRAATAVSLWDPVGGLSGPEPPPLAGELQLPLVGARRSSSPPDTTRRSVLTLWPMILVGDALSLVVALTLALLVLAAASHVGSNGLGQFGVNFVRDLVFVPVGQVMLAVYGLYWRRHRRLRHGSFGDLVHLLHAMAVGAVATLGMSALLHRTVGVAEISTTQLVLIAAFGIATVPAGRAIVWWLRTGAVRSGRGDPSRVLLVGSGMMVDRIRSYIADDPGIELVGCVDDDPAPGTTSIGGIADVARLCEELQVDRVLIGFSRTHPADAVERLRPLLGNVAITIVPRYFELLSWRSQIDDICGLPVIDVAPPRLSASARMVKRTVDFVVATVGLVLLSPVMAMIALAIKLDSPGPLLFRQQRVGRGGEHFTIYKFRTMHEGSEHQRGDLAGLNDVDGPMFKIHDDPRVFRVGRFLRRTSLDEIPQLYNVLRGHMSLVGPRPFVIEESEHLSGWAARRFEVRPGLSGLWQISGRNNLTFDELRRLDYLYVASWSLWWDLKILWHTPGSVLKSRGAY